jgi:hypothetical protein
MIRWERTKSAQVKGLLYTTGDSETRPKVVLYGNRQVTAGIFSNAQQEDVMRRTQWGICGIVWGSLRMLPITAN